MNYQIKPSYLSFGSGYSIKLDDIVCEQIIAKNDIIVKIFKTSDNKPDKYTGVIFKNNLNNNESDFQFFQDITNKLSQNTGQIIDNDKQHFNEFLSKGYTSYNQKFNDTLFLNYNLNTTNRGDITQDFISDRLIQSTHKGALMMYIAGMGLINSLIQDPNEREMINICYATIVPFAGPVPAGLFISLIEPYYNKRVDNPTFAFNKFINEYNKLENLKNSFGNVKKRTKLISKLDESFSLIKESNKYIACKKGFLIGYPNQDRDEIINLFSYLLEQKKV